MDNHLLRRAWGRDRRITVALLTFLFVVIASTSAVSYVVAQNPHDPHLMTRDSHEAVVAVLETQIALLKWIGIAIVTSLVGAVGLLYRELVKSTAVSRGDLVQGIERREEILEENQKTMGASTLAVQNLSANIEKLLAK